MERVLRSVPDSRVVLLIRPGRRATPMQRATKEILKNDCFDRLRAAARRPVRRRGGRPGVRRGRRRGHRRPRPRRRGPAAAVRVRRRHPLGRHRELRLPPRRRRRGQPARPVPGGGGHRGGRPAGRGRRAGGAPSTSSRCRPPTWPAPTRARPERSCWRATPSPWRWTGGPRWRRPGGQRGDTDAESRQPERLAQFAKAARGELGGAGLHLAGRAGRAAAGGLGQEADGRRWARPGPSPSAGPTPIPTPRPWASGPWSPSSATRSP